jgi:ketosteroid isomerase-like protein
MISRTRGFLCCSVVAATFALALSWAAAAGESMSSAMTEKVLDHHLKAFGDRNMTAILEDYTEESVLLTPTGRVQGHEQLQPVFEAFFADFAKPGAVFETKQRIIEGEVAYIVWTAETADNVYELGTDTFIVKDGKIAVQSFAAKVAPKN